MRKVNMSILRMDWNKDLLKGMSVYWDKIEYDKGYEGLYKVHIVEPYLPLEVGTPNDGWISIYWIVDGEGMIFPPEAYNE